MPPEDSEAPDAESVERSLDALEARGARGYDAAACDCVRALLTRAEEIGGGVATILVARADAHVRALAERFERDRERVRVRLTELSDEPAAEQLERALASGQIVRVARTLRRLAVVPPRRKAETRVPEAHNKAQDAQAGSSHTAPRDARGSVIPAANSSLRKRRALAYEDSVAALVASFALARAVDVVPEDAGPYNPLRIASTTLDRMREVSPFFLTVQLNRLEELASLLSLPELPAPVPEEKLLPRKKTKALKGGKKS